MSIVHANEQGVQNITFLYQGFGVVRTVMIGSQAWFITKDVCDILEHSNHRAAVSGLDEDEKGVTDAYTPGGRQSMSIVSEPGLYKLIFSSRVPKAKDFQRWITHEVLPAIRQTGTYSVPKEPDERQLRMELFRSALEHEERLDTIEQRIDKVEKKVTLDYAEQELVRRTVAKRVHEFASGDDRRDLFKQLHREIRDRWGVASYKDVKRVELQQVIQYINAWRPKVLAEV